MIVAAPLGQFPNGVVPIATLDRVPFFKQPAYDVADEAVTPQATPTPLTTISAAIAAA